MTDYNDIYAFPSDVNIGPSVDDAEWTANGGMELRDYFAAKAMNAFSITRQGMNNSAEAKHIAAHAYMTADAMMEARSK